MRCVALLSPWDAMITQWAVLVTFDVHRRKKVRVKKKRLLTQRCKIYIIST
jgi:hypothetical protein